MGGVADCGVGETWMQDCGLGRALELFQCPLLLPIEFLAGFCRRGVCVSQIPWAERRWEPPHS